MLGHKKKCLNKFEKIEIILSIFSNNKSLRQEIYATKQPRVTEKVKREIKKYLEASENGNNVPKYIGCNQNFQEGGL